MTNKFDILENIIRLNLREAKGGKFIEDNILFDYNRHSTGRGINIYLLDGDDRLHVYYDYHWFSSIYLFNEEGRKHGFLIDNAPWNKVISEKFEQFVAEIEEKKELLAQEIEKIRENRARQDREKLDKFTKKFENV